jgi:hypothetical protein
MLSDGRRLRTDRTDQLPGTVMDFTRHTRIQLKQVFEAIRELMEPLEPVKKRPTGFVTPEEKPGKTKAAKNK